VDDVEVGIWMAMNLELVTRLREELRAAGKAH